MSWVAKCWRDYDLPNDRTPESFAYKIEELDFENVTDTLYTDDPLEAGRLVAHMLNEAYDARVTNDGKVTLNKSRA